MDGGLIKLNDNMKYVIETRRNKDITPIKLNKIVSLKMQHWKYTRKEHINWIQNNISENDYHLLLFDNSNNLIAYLNLIYVTVNFGSDSQEYLGIGNVCVDVELGSKGYGLLVMNLATFYLKQLEQPGILLCKNKLNPFYQKAGWNIYAGNSYISNKLNLNSVFTTNKVVASEIYVNKNF